MKREEALELQVNGRLEILFVSYQNANVCKHAAAWPISSDDGIL